MEIRLARHGRHVAVVRLYWPGGHVRRMQQRLAAWQQEAAPPS